MSAVRTRDGQRAAIVDVAARLLQQEGVAAVTTRAVADGAGVQAPTIYRLFGDKDGLLEAVAERVLAVFAAAKADTVETASTDGVDPVDDLRAGWRTYVDFGLANPALYALLVEPRRARSSPAARSGRDVLLTRVRRIAATGWLRVSERRAVELVHAAGTGAVLALLSTPPEDRDPGLPDDLLDAVLQRILTEAPDAPDAAVAPAIPAAVALRACVAELDGFSEAERAMLVEWLDRVIDAR